MKTVQGFYGLTATKISKCCPASGLHSPRNKLITRSPLLLLLAGIFGLTAGCTLLRIGGAGKPTGESHLVEEQQEMQRFADDLLAQGGQGLDESAERLGTDAAREEVVRLKLVLGSSVLSIVSGPNPNANLLDLVFVTVLTRMAIEDYWMHTTNGAAFQPWLDASRVLETNAWELAARSLQPAQVAELRAGIAEWYAENPGVRTTFFARPEAFVHMMRTTRQKEAQSTSVFSLFNLDPTAGLAPAVREATRDRLFAERAMYTAQRMPFLLRLQGELFTYEVGEQPAVQVALTNSTRLSESAASLSRTASQLPDRFSAERKELVADLESQQGKLRDLAVDVDRTLVSGEKMSSSVTMTITNFDNLMKRFGVGEPHEPRTNVSNARPFNILDYAKTADEINAMAQNVNALIASVNQSEPEIQRLSRQADADMEKVVDRGFRLGLVLIAVLLTGAVLTGLVYRFFAEKIKSRAAAGITHS